MAVTAGDLNLAEFDGMETPREMNVGHEEGEEGEGEGEWMEEEGEEGDDFLGVPGEMNPDLFEGDILPSYGGR